MNNARSRMHEVDYEEKKKCPSRETERERCMDRTNKRECVESEKRCIERNL
jgi:hypothetical protein